MKLGPYQAGEIVVGDCLGVMRQMPDGCVDLVVTDPPYASGARRESAKTLRGALSRSNNANWFEGDNLTTTGLAMLVHLNALEWMRILKPNCPVLCFTDWRMYPTASAALETGGLRLIHCIVWDKVHFGMGWQVRNQHEFIVLASKGKPREPARRDLGSVIACPRKSGDTDHPTEKPLGLLLELVSTFSYDGDLVFDPFMGSGTTAVAADRLGRNFFGCDISEEYVAMALERLEKDRLKRSQLEMPI